MELLTYLHVLQHRKRVILIVALVTVVVAVIGRLQMPVKYESTAILRVVPYSTNNPSSTQLAYADRIMKTYVEIGSGSVVMSNLREELGLTPDQPASVNIEIISGTELLRISVADNDPVLATDVANTLVSYLINDNAIRDVRITLMEPANIPEPPSILSIILFYALAVLVGLLGGIGMAFLLENIDPRLYDEKQVENISGLPILGYIPSISGWRVEKLIARHFPYNHAFQRLGINLQASAQEKNLHTIMVTSPEPSEGKSSVAANLAYSLAKSGCKALLIDVNLHQPTTHRYFGLTNEQGLSNTLFSNVPLENIIRETNLSGLSIITNGTMPDHLEELLLDGRQMKKVLGQLTRQYDYVILDTSAFLGLVDSMILSSLVDGVLLVTRLGMTRQVSLTTTCQQLEKMHAAILGLVINQTTEILPTSHYHYSKRKLLPFAATKDQLPLK